MTKILFYNHTATVSGAERVLLLILSQLNTREFQSVVLCPAGALQSFVAEKNVPYLPVAELHARFTWRPDYLLRYLLSFMRVMRGVRAQVKAIAPDLIHANSIRAGLVITAATIGLRTPIIWHLHDLLPHHPISTVIRLFTLTTSRLRLLAVSQATEKRFRGLLLRPFTQRLPSTVLLNCADTEIFQPPEASRNNIRAELALPGTAFVFGMIGQITARKGQQGLLRAFAQVRHQIPNAVLLIVGEPLFTAADQQYFQQLKHTVDELGLASHVRFLGARRDVPAVMQALDLLVVNSLAEPCGLVVLEGMASALPVIATAVGGNPEMIHHALSGWLVPVNDDQALATAMIKLSRDEFLRKRLATAARQKVCAHFSVAPYQQKLEQIYRQTNSSNVANPSLTAVTDN